MDSNQSHHRYKYYYQGIVCRGIMEASRSRKRNTKGQREMDQPVKDNLKKWLEM